MENTDGPERCAIMKKQRHYGRKAGCAAVIFALLLSLWGCTAQQEADAFIFQSEGYFAAPVSSTLSVALTGLSTDMAQLAVFQNVTSMSFEGTDTVHIKDFRIESREAVAGYSACTMTITLAFDKTGVTEATALRLQFQDGGERSYPIGTWTFDVQDAPDHPELLDVWSSPAATTNGDVFPYHYELLDETASIQSIQYGPDQIADPGSGGITVHDSIAEGNLELSGDAPVRLIRPRIMVEQNGEAYSVYGVCCYCGAMNVT